MEFGIVLRMAIGRFQLQQKRHERFRDIASAEGAEKSALVGAGAKRIGPCLVHAAPAFAVVYGALRAAETKAAIFSALFFPGASSTPDDASTKCGAAMRMAR